MENILFELIMMYIFFVNIFSWYRVNLSNKLKTLFICGSFQKSFKWFLVVNLELCGTKFAKHRHLEFPFFICCSCKSSKTLYRQTLLILIFAEKATYLWKIENAFAVGFSGKPFRDSRPLRSPRHQERSQRSPN